MKKTLALAALSEQALVRLWELGLRISWLLAIVASRFPSVFSGLLRAVEDAFQWGRNVSESTLARVRLPVPSLWPTGFTRTVEEAALPHIGAAKVSFLLHVTAAAKAAAELAERVVAQTPHPALLEAKAAGPTGAALTDLQRASEATLRPDLRSIASAFQEYTSRAIPSFSTSGILKPLQTTAGIGAGFPAMGLAMLLGGPSGLLPDAEVEPPAPYLPPLGARLGVELLAQLAPSRRFGAALKPVFEFRAGLQGSGRAAIMLPSVILGWWTPTLEAVSIPLGASPSMPMSLWGPFFAAPMVSSLLIPPVIPSYGGGKTQLPLAERPMPSTPLGEEPQVTALLTLRRTLPLLYHPRERLSLGPTWIGHLAEEIREYRLPSHGIPWFPLATASIASSVSLLFSDVHRMAAEAFAGAWPSLGLEQPGGPPSALSTPRLEGARILAFQAESLLAGLGKTGLEAASWRFPTAPIIFPPAVLPSLAQGEKVPPILEVCLGAATRLPRVVAERAAPLRETAALGSLLTEAFSTLPLEGWAAQGVMRRRVGDPLGEVIGRALGYMALAGMRSTRPSYSGALADLGMYRDLGETMVARLPPERYEAPRAIEPYVPRVLSSGPRPLPASRLPGPTIENIFNLTVSGDSEEDLRELERRIARILAEQLRRYYGSAGVLGG